MVETLEISFAEVKINCELKYIPV